MDESKMGDNFVGSGTVDLNPILLNHKGKHQFKCNITNGNK